MDYEELRNYIHDLQQSGFDTVRLKVQLQKKLAFPLITLVMACWRFPSPRRAVAVELWQEWPSPSASRSCTG